MKKILVIEDELGMRRNIGALLRYKEYEPIAAERGAWGWNWRAGKSRI